MHIIPGYFATVTDPTGYAAQCQIAHDFTKARARTSSAVPSRFVAKVDGRWRRVYVDLAGGKKAGKAFIGAADGHQDCAVEFPA